MVSDPFLPYGRQAIDDDDIGAVVDVLRSDWLTTGPAVESLEKALCETFACHDCVAVANGTAALHLVFQALGLGAGDKVIVPSVTFLATANAARYVDAEVVFADVDPVTGLLTSETCRQAIERAGGSVKAVIPVHLGGRLVDLKAFAALVDEIGLAVIEDACHAIGGVYPGGKGGGFPVGSCRYSDAATFSFHPVKTITAGEGGAVSCRDAGMAEKIRRLRSHGMERLPGGWRDSSLGFEGEESNPWYYEMHEIGWNYRMTDIQCALAESQLGKLEKFVSQRRVLAGLYDTALAPIEGISPVPRDNNATGGWHLYQVAVDFEKFGISRGDVMRALRARGIGTQVHYIPLHWQPYYRDRYGSLDLPGAACFYKHTLSLPLFPAMETADVGRVTNALKQVLDIE